MITYILFFLLLIIIFLHNYSLETFLHFERGNTLSSHSFDKNPHTQIYNDDSHFYNIQDKHNLDKGNAKCCISNHQKQFVSKKHPTKPQSFCSRACNSKSRTNKIERSCLACNKVFYVIPYILKKSGGGTYCSQSCRLTDWNNKSLISQMPGSYRQNAWKVFDKKCYDCNLQDERVLVIHHIDGNRKNGLISNLIPVCHNCHCIRHIILSGDKCLPSYRGRD